MRSLLVLLAVLVSCPAAAPAAVVSAGPAPDGRLTILFVADAGEANYVRLRAAAGATTVSDRWAHVRAGAGCTARNAHTALCPGAPAGALLDADLGDGPDTATLAPGRDAVPVSFDVDGGPGKDTLDFSGAARGVAVDMAAQTLGADGAARGFEHIVGSHYQDVLLGNDENNVIDGQPTGDNSGGPGVADRIAGRGGRDQLGGSNGPDVIDGGPEPDHIDGFGGRDLLRGGGGSDFLQTYADANARIHCGGQPDSILIGDVNVTGVPRVARDCEEIGGLGLRIRGDRLWITLPRSHYCTLLLRVGRHGRAHRLRRPSRRLTLAFALPAHGLRRVDVRLRKRCPEGPASFGPSSVAFRLLP
ncbi:MAG TPA: hypothetical protein VF549_05605 [Solirubrobacteraceae bacterium]